VYTNSDSTITSNYDQCWYIESKPDWVEYSVEVNKRKGLFGELGSALKKAVTGSATEAEAADIKTTSSQVVEGTEILSNTVTFKHMAAYCNVPTKGTLYIVGSCCGWPEPSGSNKQTLLDGGWYVTETEIGSNIFKGVVEMPAGDLTFRFYSKLTGWGSDDNPEGSIGQQDKDEAKEFTLPHTGTCMPGKGSWSFPGFPGGKLDITVDMNNKSVSFVLL
jgi:hypothetical protein